MASSIVRRNVLQTLTLKRLLSSGATQPASTSNTVDSLYRLPSSDTTDSDSIDEDWKKVSVKLPSRPLSPNPDAQIDSLYTMEFGKSYMREWSSAKALSRLSQMDAEDDDSPLTPLSFVAEDLMVPLRSRFEDQINSSLRSAEWSSLECYTGHCTAAGSLIETKTGKLQVLKRSSSHADQLVQTLNHN